MRHFPTLVGVLTLLALALPNAAAASEPIGLDVVVVLDVSGSMKTHDPRRLSQFAVEVLAAFLNDSDRLGLVPLGGDAAPLPLTPLTEARASLPARLEAFTYGGGTPCGDALAAADAMLDGATSPPSRQVVVFLTDGVCHEGAADKRTRDEALLGRAEAMGRRGRRLFGIPLGPEADLALVSALTALSDTAFTPARVDDARQLPAQFARLSALFRGTEARALPLARGANTLEIDPYVRRLIVLGTVDRAALTLSAPTPPEGATVTTPPRVASGRFPRAGASWSGWSTLHLDRPDAGPWRLDASEAAAAVIVYDYDLSPVLRVTRPDGAPPEGGAAAGETLHIEALLVTPDGAAVTPAFLRDATVRLDVRAPGQTEWRALGAMSPDAAGRVVQDTAFQGLGRHHLRARIVRGESLDLTAFLPLTVGPVLALPAAADDDAVGGLRCLDPEGDNRFEVTLRDALGAPLTTDEALLSELDLSLWAAPGAAEPTPLTRVALFAPGDTPGAFVAHWKPTSPGPWRTEIRAVSAAPSPRGGNLDLRVPGPPAYAPAPSLGLTGAAPQIALRPGDAVSFVLNVTDAGTSLALAYRADMKALTLPGGVSATAETVGTAITVTLTAADPLDAGGVLSGRVAVTAEGPCVPAHEVGAITVTGEATPWTFWEAWGDYIVIAIILLGLIALLLKVARCRAHTSEFPPGFALTIGRNRPQNVRTSCQAADRAAPRRVVFGCRSARIHWFDEDFQARGRRDSFFVEACPGGRAQLVTRGARVVYLSPGTNPTALPADQQPDENATTLLLERSRIYQIGDVFFRI